MTSLFASRTLGAIVAVDYRAAAVLEQFGLDFCCGGKRTLEEACQQRGVSIGAVDAALQVNPGRSAADAPDATWEPDELTRYIVRRHHAYVRAQLPVIAAHLSKLRMVHGERHPELWNVAGHFEQIALARAMSSGMSEKKRWVRVPCPSAQRGFGARTATGRGSSSS